METWSFYSAGIRIARFWPAAGTLEWACLDDGAGVLGARGAMNEENAEWFARRYQFSPAAFFEGLSAWNEAFAGGGSPVSCGGSRYDKEAYDILWKSRKKDAVSVSLPGVLKLTVEEAAA